MINVEYIEKSDRRTVECTILATCSPVSGCVSGEQSTTTTTITTSVPFIWIKEPLEPDTAEPLEEIDDGTVQYFYDLFKKQGISLEDGRDLVAHCGGNRPGIPLFCLNSFTSDFCQEVQKEPAKSLSKTFAGLDRTLGPIGPIDPLRGFHLSMQTRRLLTKRGLCSDWKFEFNWSSAKSKYTKSYLDYIGIIKKQCLRFKTNDEGSIDTRCGTYSLAIQSVPFTSTTEPPSEPIEVPKTPLGLKSVVCEDEANFPRHSDVRKGDQRSAAQIFCESYFFRRSHWSRYMDSQNTTVSDATVISGTNYSFSVSWIDGCETTVASQDPWAPLMEGDVSCADIFVNAFRNCINGGVGGYIDAGCLRYHFIGGKR